MILTNFDLNLPACATELVGLGHRWDLHSFADFEGLEVRLAQDIATLRWQVPTDCPVDNPWGSPGNTSRGCAIVFTGLRALHLTPRHAEADAEGDKALSDVSKVTPELGSHRHREHWLPGEHFHLRFEFDSGRSLEVAADRAELVCIP